MKRLTAVLLAVLMLLLPLASCSETNGNTDETKPAGEQPSAEQTEETEVTRENVPDSLPDGLNFDAATIQITAFGLQNCQDYDCIGELKGDVVLDAVYNRNISVEDRLNVKLNYVAGAADWEGFPSEVMVVLQAGTDDFDLIVEESSRLFQQSVQGYFRDFMTMNYVDLNQPWWYSDMMEESQLDNSKRFFLNGDICLTVLMGASTMYFDKSLFTDHFGSLDALYGAVLDGTWTYDLFADYCRRIYTDVNGNGKTDAEDVMGFRFEQWGVPNHMSMSTGLNYAVRDEEGFPVLDIYNENGIRWGETLYKLLYTDNISAEGSKIDTFKAKTSLFLPGTFETALTLRDTDFEYGILPYPKLDESLDYLCGAATANGCGVAIPNAANPAKLDAVCASVEALCAEAYRKVVPAWYDTALKIKYSDATIDSQMVDVIYAHINSPFIMMADKALNIGSVYTNAVYGSSSDGAFASYWAKNEKRFVKAVDSMIGKYKKLP